ncbi:MAG: hypothetical protein QOF06_427 [Solirubrobacterales bacterium]|nr:hypothetical protein [Solirubrobacterales bacterium]
MTRAVLATALPAALCATALLLAPTADASRWHPKPTTAPWQWQLQGKIDTSIDAGVYEVDGFEVAAGTVAKLHRQGRRVICYLDVGSWESYRPDAGRFPKAVLGRAYEGYPDERWLDIRRLDILIPIMRDRLQRCADKGFDGVDPDNVNGYENDTGFPLTAADQVAFDRALADVAHELGLAVTLKNTGGLVPRLRAWFDGAVVESCFRYHECALYAPFVAADKPVYVIEYDRRPGRFCAEARRRRFSAIFKRLSLSAFRRTCGGAARR